MITPTLSGAEIEEIARDGLRAYDASTAVYIRPMYWALEGSELGVAPSWARPALPSASKQCRCRRRVPRPR